MGLFRPPKLPESPAWGLPVGNYTGGVFAARTNSYPVRCQCKRVAVMNPVVMRARPPSR